MPRARSIVAVDGVRAQDAAMRRWILGGFVSIVAAACAQRAPQRLAGDGELVLELGGAGASLSRMLQKSGVELLPSPLPVPTPEASPEDSSKTGTAVDASSQGSKKDASDGVAAGGPKPDDAKKTDEPKSSDEPKPDAKKPTEGAEPGTEIVEVVLGANETLMDIASKHLGTAKRFKDIMKWNGWNERDTRRLKPGTKVKLHKPVAAGASR